MVSKALPLITTLMALLLSVSIWALLKVSDERDLLSVQIDALESKIEALNNKNQSLQKEFDEYRNGADRLLLEANSAFETKNYDAVKQYSDILMQSFAGSTQSIEAIKLVERAIEQQEIDKIQEHIRSLKSIKELKEQNRLDAISNKEHLRSIIRIKSITTSKPNYNGYVDFSFLFQNKSSKTIKYVYLHIAPYNAVGDKVTCSNSGESTKRGSVTGPIATGDWFGENGYWNDFWQNSTIVGAQIEDISITYMDGTQVYLNDEDVKQVIY